MLNFNILYNTEVFINNIDVKELKIKYNNNESFSEVCYFIFKYLQTLDHVFLTLKLINVKIFEEKSYFN